MIRYLFKSQDFGTWQWCTIRMIDTITDIEINYSFSISFAMYRGWQYELKIYAPVQRNIGSIPRYYDMLRINGWHEIERDLALIWLQMTNFR